MPSDRRTIRTHRYSTYLGLLLLLLCGEARAAEPLDHDWQIDTYVDLSGGNTYLIENGKGANYSALGGELGVELWSSESAAAAGLFASYELNPGSGGDDLWISGGWTRYRFGRLEISATAAYVDEGSADALWMYASELKFRPRSGHKLSIQALGLIGDSGTPAFEVAYHVRLSQSISMSVGIGLGSNRMYDLAANTKIVWSIY